METYLDLLNYLPGATSLTFQDLISSSLIGRISHPVLGNVVTGPRNGKNLRAAREQRVTGPHFQLLDWSRFNVPSPVALLRDLVKQKLAGSQKKLVSGPHFQLLDQPDFTSRHGYRCYGTSVRKVCGQLINNAFQDLISSALIGRSLRPVTGNDLTGPR